MTDALREIAVWACLFAGSVFSVIGGIGVLRMPDFYTRTHAASITDTLGATLILLGLGVHSGLNLITVKLILIFSFLYLTSPTAAHALVKAAYSKGLEAPDVQEASDASRALRNRMGGEP
ncbi:MAG: monovalent cation/H(+) antiporter subunit G [bacterium]|nr:sodium:proton antiporter [Deltaproteobacteria bacterium]MCP4904256.1 monovalent cation/H(+) antiporter subunit G [bacterium]